MCGMGTARAAIRATIASVGQSTFPMQISSISAVVIPVLPLLPLLVALDRQPARAVERRVDGATFASPPFLALVRGVRTALTTTTSRGLRCFGDTVGDGMVATAVMNRDKRRLDWDCLVGAFGFSFHSFSQKKSKKIKNGGRFIQIGG